MFALGDTLIAFGNVFEDNFGGYYGGAIFVTSGKVGLPFCDAANHDIEMPCKTAHAVITSNIFRRNFAEFGGAVQLALGNFQFKSTAVIDSNLFVDNMVREFQTAHPHSGAHAIYCESDRFRIRNNTFVKNNRHHDYLVRNTGAVVLHVTVGVDLLYSRFERNIIAQNKGGGLSFRCDGQIPPLSSFIEDPTKFQQNVFWNNVDCRDTLFNMGRGNARGGDPAGCDSMPVPPAPCCNLPNASIDPCQIVVPGGCYPPDDHPPAVCMPTWYPVPDSGEANFVLDPRFCSGDTSVASGHFALHCQSFALPANNVWGAQIGWSGFTYCGCGGGSTCPFVAVWDGQQYLIDNNVLPLSEHVCRPPPYVSDMYPLRRAPADDDGLLRLRLTEFEQERSYFDEVRLWFVDLPEGVGIATTDEGSVVYYRGVSTPAAAFDPEGVDVSAALANSDTNSVRFGEGTALTVTLAIPPALGKTMSHIGGAISLPIQKQQNNDPKWAGRKADLAPWDAGSGQTQADYYDLMGGLEMAVEGADGGWVAVDTLHPRDAWTAHYTDLDAYLHEAGDSARIRYTWFGEHGLNQVAIGQLVAPPELVEVPMVSATHPITGNVSALLASPDSVYATIDVGESIDLVFEAPSSPGSGTRQYLIETKGYYLLYAGKKGESIPPAATSGLPTAFRLRDAAPNPTSSSTRFRYELPRATVVRLRIYDVSGRVVASLLDAARPAGYHAHVWDGRDTNGAQVGAGIYFARMEAGSEQRTTKLVLMR